MLSQHLISVKESLYKLTDTFFLQLTYQIFKSMAGLDASEIFKGTGFIPVPFFIIFS
jgi:hypothetical protein